MKEVEDNISTKKVSRNSNEEKEVRDVNDRKKDSFKRGHSIDKDYDVKDNYINKNKKKALKTLSLNEKDKMGPEEDKDLFKPHKNNTI